MAMHIALLRAVNLAGLNKVGMADLRALAQDLGLEEPRTLLQSGNLVFRSDQRADRLEKLLEDATKEQLGVATDFFVRSAKEWRAVTEGNPFPAAAKADPGHLLVMTLKSAPTSARIKALAQAISGREAVRGTGGRHVYLVYPDGVGRSKLTTALIEKKLDTRGTARNWNTVLKLAALVE